MCALRQMDMTGDGHDEIVACWWDGTTLIVDKDRNIATFRFDDRVSAFLCGHYAVHHGVSVPCFVYVTLFGEVVVYYNVTLEGGVSVQTLVDESSSGSMSGWDRRELPGLYNSILYGINTRDAQEYVSILKEKLAQAENEHKELLARVQSKTNNTV